MVERLIDILALAAVDFPAASVRFARLDATRAADGSWLAVPLVAEQVPLAANQVYLLAETGRVEQAGAAAEALLARFPDEELLVIAAADMRHRRGAFRAAFALVADRAGPGASDAMLVKHCDFARDIGLGFISERVLERAVAEGRTWLTLRLAEHHREQRNWAALLACVDCAPEHVLEPALLFLRGRAAVALLLEPEVIATADRLWLIPEQGPAYAQLLLDLWRWRIGDIEESPPVPSGTGLSYWATLDAESIRAAPDPGFHAGTIVRSASGWRALRPRENLPNVLMIGAQRAATTWLWQNLLRRSDVQPLPWKESVFFSDAFASPFDVDPGLAGSVGEGEMGYWDGPTRNLFRYCRLFGAGFPVRADFSPTYCELPEASVAVLRDLLGPDVRILFCARDPVDRAWSNLKFDLKLSGIEIGSLDLSMRIAHYTSDVAMRRADAVAVIDRWSRYFPRLHVLFFDDVVADPGGTVSRVAELLGIGVGDGNATPHVGRINESLADDLPSVDRAFLLGLHRDSYRRAAVRLGGAASRWAERHERLLG